MVEVVAVGRGARTHAPQRAAEPLLREAGPALGGLLADLDGGGLPTAGLRDHPDDVMRSCLHQRVPGAAGPSVGPEDHEVVGEPGHADALIRTRAVTGVEARQVETVATADWIAAIVL